MLALVHSPLSQVELLLVGYALVHRFENNVWEFKLLFRKLTLYYFRIIRWLFLRLYFQLNNRRLHTCRRFCFRLSQIWWFRTTWSLRFGWKGSQWRWWLSKYPLSDPTMILVIFGHGIDQWQFLRLFVLSRCPCFLVRATFIIKNSLQDILLMGRLGKILHFLCSVIASLWIYWSSFHILFLVDLGLIHLLVEEVVINRFLEELTLKLGGRWGSLPLLRLIMSRLILQEVVTLMHPTDFTSLKVVYIQRRLSILAYLSSLSPIIRNPCISCLLRSRWNNISA